MGIDDINTSREQGLDMQEFKLSTLLLKGDIVQGLFMVEKLVKPVKADTYINNLMGVEEFSKQQGLTMQ